MAEAAGRFATRMGMVHIPTPPEAGKVVGICNYRGRVIVACEYGLLEFEHNDGMPTLAKIAMVSGSEGMLVEVVPHG